MSPVTIREVGASVRTLHVLQGACEASASSDQMLTTILGSCVCTCLCDPVAAVGGMNHFLLPYAGFENSHQLRYGLHAMELLINAVLKLGASRNRLEAKIFGGAMMSDRLGSIGQANAEFALQYLAKEAILCTGQSLGGTRARRIRFWPTTGRAQQMFLAAHENLPVESPQIRIQGGAGDVTFF
ncbi:chemotaxis protein CheD [Cereibacter sphaeroides]|uniref:chemotaxis protein CheD n=1 Tax=Cereibacter sphaeroides TaxID=1063 RepID=UPI001F2BCAB5|nr:chemotaxis protein CheD [Cereibacter sphaeroides]MCE6950369.1 chemotaxis protein CheD [Cereibacter sphaeroides]